MPRIRACICAVLLTGAAIALMAGTPAARAGDRDCSDFSSQAAAQAYFDRNGGSPSNNVDRLDADGDGRVCETNPCPCSGPGDGGGGASAPRRFAARVTHVVDGDTIDVRALGGRRRAYRVRFIGIDTPEKYGGRECGSGRASASMRRLAPLGARVRVVTDPSQPLYDRYERLLAYVMRGRDLGRAQISRGLARVYVVGSRFRRFRSYRRAQRAARVHSRGVWRLCGGAF